MNKRKIDISSYDNEQKRKKMLQQSGLADMNKYERISSLITFSKNENINSYIKSALTPLSQSYLAQLVDVFNFRDHPIQSIFPYGRASRLYTAGARFTFTTSTTSPANGYGFVACTPYMMMQNTNASIFYSSSTTIIDYIPAAADVSTSTNYVSSTTTDSPFASSDFAVNQREYRIVAAGIRCRNISPRDYLGGSIVALATPNNATGADITYQSACDYESTKPAPFDQDWHTVFWKPTHPDNHVFWSSYTTSFNSPTGWAYNPIFCIIQAPDDTYATKIDCEVLCVFEVLGYAERGSESRARDIEEGVKSLTLLQNACSYHGSLDSINYSVPYDLL